jgi:hypothetical protein
MHVFSILNNKEERIKRIFFKFDCKERYLALLSWPDLFEEQFSFFHNTCCINRFQSENLWAFAITSNSFRHKVLLGRHAEFMDSREENILIKGMNLIENQN